MVGVNTCSGWFVGYHAFISCSCAGRKQGGRFFVAVVWGADFAVVGVDVYWYF